MAIKLEINTAEISGREWDALIAFALAMKTSVPSKESIRATAAGLLDAVERELTKTQRAPAQTFVVTETTPTSITLAPADNPAAGIDTDAALQSAGFGSGTVAPPVPVPDAGAVPPALPAMPPAPPAAATVPNVTPPASTGNAQLDNKGLPWDNRIHSGEKTKNKDGSWRNKRGLPEGTVERVEAELRALMGVGAPPTPVPPVPGAPAAPMNFMTLLTKVTKSIKDGQISQDRVNATLVEFSLPNLPAIHHRPDLVQGFHDRLFGGV